MSVAQHHPRAFESASCSGSARLHPSHGQFGLRPSVRRSKRTVQGGAAENPSHKADSEARGLLPIMETRARSAMLSLGEPRREGDHFTWQCFEIWAAPAKTFAGDFPVGSGSMQPPPEAVSAQPSWLILDTPPAELRALQHGQEEVLREIRPVFWKMAKREAHQG